MYLFPAVLMRDTQYLQRLYIENRESALKKPLVPRGRSRNVCHIFSSDPPSTVSIDPSDSILPFIMPAISSGKVLITGANGFIATWAVKVFLDAGFSVRGTVRSPTKADHLKTMFSSHGDRLEFAIVPDMAAVCTFFDTI